MNKIRGLNIFIWRFVILTDKGVEEEKKVCFQRKRNNFSKVEFFFVEEKLLIFYVYVNKSFGIVYGYIQVSKEIFKGEN